MVYYKSVSAIAGGGKTAVLLNTFSKGLARCSGSNWVFFPDPNWLCAPGANNGQVYFATIYSFGEIPPYSEMGEIGFFDALPDNLTYPILKEYFSIAEKKLHVKQENQSLNK